MKFDFVLQNTECDPQRRGQWDEKISQFMKQT